MQEILISWGTISFWTLRYSCCVLILDVFELYQTENVAAINVLAPKGTFEKTGGHLIFSTPMISGLLRCNYASMSRRPDVFVVNLHITVWNMLEVWEGTTNTLCFDLHYFQLLPQGEGNTRGRGNAIIVCASLSLETLDRSSLNCVQQFPWRLTVLPGSGPWW